MTSATRLAATFATLVLSWAAVTVVDVSASEPGRDSGSEVRVEAVLAPAGPTSPCPCPGEAPPCGGCVSGTSLPGAPPAADIPDEAPTREGAPGHPGTPPVRDLFRPPT